MGSNDMPELGSKISLISKADIRYEGKLFTVDPQECTIALASVRSFGTEDRPTDTPVPAQTQVYEYILFRATDIKDISVVPPNPPVIYDPAILQLSAPPSAIPSSGSRFSSSGNSLGQSMLGQLVGRERSSGGFNPMQSGFNPPQIHRPHQAPSQPTLQNPLAGGLGDFSKLDSDNRRSVTPGVLRKDSPPRSPPRRTTRQQPVGARQRPSSDNRIERPERMDRTERIERPDRHDRGNRMDMRSNGPQAPIGGQRYQGGMGMSKGPMERGGGGPRQQWNHRGHPMQNRGMTRPRPLFANRGKTPTKPLKFDSDYDFDKANNEFEELRQSLTVQLKVSDPPVPAPAPADDKKDDSGNETAVGECEEEGMPIAYDKAKSFFDNISCEALERSKGRSQRTDWRKERQLNSETFGVAMSNRRYYYNNQRGRGYYKGGGNQHWAQYRAPRQQNNIVAKA